MSISSPRSPPPSPRPAEDLGEEDKVICREKYHLWEGHLGSEFPGLSLMGPPDGLEHKEAERVRSSEGQMLEQNKCLREKKRLRDSKNNSAAYSVSGRERQKMSTLGFCLLK